MKILRAIVFLWITSAAAATAEDLPLQPASTRSRNPGIAAQDVLARSVYLEFTQERHLKLFTEPLKSEGVMLIERPDQIRWETTAPYQSILLGNHKIRRAV